MYTQSGNRHAALALHVSHFKARQVNAEDYKSWVVEPGNYFAIGCRVTGQWVKLLRESAESVLEEGLRLSLDLENICFIDCEGLALLKSLIDRGVQQVNAPLLWPNSLGSGR